MAEEENPSSLPKPNPNESITETQDHKLSSSTETQDHNLSSSTETQDNKLSSSSMADVDEEVAMEDCSDDDDDEDNEEEARKREEVSRGKRPRREPNNNPNANRIAIMAQKEYTKEESDDLKRRFKEALPPVKEGEEHDYCDFCFKNTHVYDDCPSWNELHYDYDLYTRPNKRPRLVPKFTGKYYPPITIPQLNSEEDVEEVKRLMKREIASVPAGVVDGDHHCEVCYSKDHRVKDCKCLEEIPKGVEVLSPRYDKVCLGCGRIGVECCSKGSSAFMKCCYLCMENGHWFWEELCTKDFRPNVRLIFNWQRLKDRKPFLNRPLVMPSPVDRKDVSEVLRLKKRKITAPVEDGFCEVCYAKGHACYECEWLDSVPENAIVGPNFDVSCTGCGKIGMSCCGVGGHVNMKMCIACFTENHWFWEETCKIGNHSHNDEKEAMEEFSDDDDDDDDDDEEEAMKREEVSRGKRPRREPNNLNANRIPIIAEKEYTKEEIDELKRQFKEALPPVPEGEEHNYCDFCFKKTHAYDDCPRWNELRYDYSVFAYPNKRPMLVPKFTGKYYLQRKIPQLNSEEDVEEIKRLMKREIPPVPAGVVNGDHLCEVCYSKDHSVMECVCFEEIPKGVEVLSPKYDVACLGCGRIGLECCSKGVYAAMKSCYFCLDDGHWFWEELCTKDFRRNARQTFNWQRIKDEKPFLKRPLVIPSPVGTKDDASEVLRLKERKITAPVEEGCCEICYAKGHPYYECEWLDSAPENAIVGPNFDVSCTGCGKIGMRCCGVGGHVNMKMCIVCFADHHWFWEETCKNGNQSDSD